MRKINLALAALAAACTAIPATASTVVADQWYSFSFGGLGNTFIGGFNLGTDPASILALGPNWTFTLANAGSITFVDGFLSGDQFTITDFGTAIGSTSAPTVGSDCTIDITVCLNTAAISKGTFALAAGAHSINGSVILSAPNTTGGGGFFRINSIVAVPEPATWAMMLIGFGAIGVALRRRRKLAALA